MSESMRTNVNEWNTMVISHRTREIHRIVATALELREEEVRVEETHRVWVKDGMNMHDGRSLGGIRNQQKSAVMRWYRMHMADEEEL